MKGEKTKQVEDLKMLECILIDQSSCIKRVPGGYIYETGGEMAVAAVFVPFDGFND